MKNLDDVLKKSETGRSAGEGSQNNEKKNI